MFWGCLLHGLALAWGRKKETYDHGVTKGGIPKKYDLPQGLWIIDWVGTADWPLPLFFLDLLFLSVGYVYVHTTAATQEARGIPCPEAGVTRQL